MRAFLSGWVRTSAQATPLDFVARLSFKGTRHGIEPLELRADHCFLKGYSGMDMADLSIRAFPSVAVITSESRKEVRSANADRPLPPSTRRVIKDDLPEACSGVDVYR